MIDDLKAQLETANEQLKEYVRDAAPSSMSQTFAYYHQLDADVEILRTCPCTTEGSGQPLQSCRDQEEAGGAEGRVRGLVGLGLHRWPVVVVSAHVSDPWRRFILTLKT